jgi:hypothetical protein
MPISLWKGRERLSRFDPPGLWVAGLARHAMRVLGLFGQSPHELAGGAVDRLGEAVPICFQRELQHCAAWSAHIDQDVLRDAVVVVGIIRRW